MTRKLFAGVLTGLLVTGFALLGAGTAGAHSAAIGSSPADGAQIDASPARVSVTFNEDLQPNFPSMTVTGPDGNLWSKGQPLIEGATASIEVGELGPAGEYKIAYRVTSADGHPVSGTRSFTLTKAGNGTPGAKANANAASGGSDDGGVPLWVFIAGAVVLFGGGLAFALLGGKNKQRK
ncbi:copper resistance CopC family protein [Nocardia huaxiensis]|uniref:Copper resistance protein CopC n=1 Tax=Nocardia huaxiensis TaxID=2755382 RepID=A0A7D6ZAQ6_9NOCA|nr:copper resistance CopC family protein [Nocardia huaxiensis]QLY31108.1 copper resistance protein CopC [Nocardia huaxiensis]UFS94636.1 copper resistance protein CopC [Nocardia huaxiensis]